MTASRPTVIDLFGGAGGLGLGFTMAGFEIVESIDCWEPAMATHARNIGEHIRVEAIGSSTSLRKADVIIGGPPCQGFSSAGMRREDDYRNSLVGVFAELIAQHRPLAFVFENVEGFLTSAGGQRVHELLDPLVAAGYKIHLRKINAANYGVPQLRKRVIAIGGLGWEPEFPQATHRAHGAPGVELAASGLPVCPSMWEAISDLPSAAPSAPGEPFDHYARQLKGDALKRAEALLPGQTMRDLPEALWHDSYKRRANRRVKDGTPTERRGGAPAGLRRLRPDEPSKAITGGAPSEFLHPFEHRHLTLRECARLQTFPDDFIFEGTRSQRRLQIGNAVPPRLGQAIGRALREVMPSRKPKRQSGQVLSFVPTLSTGMSPALLQTSEMVAEQFGVGPTADGQLSLCL